MKKGITLVSLTIVIIIMTILAGTIVFTGNDSIGMTKINMFATEIINIQNSLDEYFVRYETYPVTTQYDFDINNIDTIYVSQFENETNTNGVINFKKIDLSRLGIDSTEYGNNEFDGDVYVVSEETGKVYYLAGVEYDNLIYYTITDELYNIVGSKQMTSTPTASSTKVYDVIFTPSSSAYTNEPVEVLIQIPKDATIMNADTTGHKSVSVETIVGDYKQVIINETGSDRQGNYTVWIDYTYNGVENTATYSVDVFDDTVPTLSVTESKESGLRKINVTYADSQSGIKLVKYADTEVANEDFFKNYGKEFKGKELILAEDKEYTLYIEDNAGNSTILKAARYAIYSDTDNSLTFIRSGQKITQGDIYNGKNVTAVYTDFIDDEAYKSETQVPWNQYITNITSVTVEDRIQPLATSYWFKGMTKCSNLDVEKLDMSKSTTMRYMFNECGETATTFTITGMNLWDVSKVTDMTGAFQKAGNVAATFDIGKLDKWNTSVVGSMAATFYGAGANSQIFDIGNLGGWNTSNVNTMISMFGNAGQNSTTFNIGDLSSWDTAKVENMQTMFYCAATKAKTFDVGDLSKWNTANVTSMSSMFQLAGRLAEKFYIGDIEAWNTSKVTNMESMFQYAGVNANWSLDLSGWTVAQVTNSTDFAKGVETKIVLPNFE